MWCPDKVERIHLGNEILLFIFMYERCLRKNAKRKTKKLQTESKLIQTDRAHRTNAILCERSNVFCNVNVMAFVIFGATDHSVHLSAIN